MVHARERTLQSASGLSEPAVPFVDLRAQYAQIREEVLAAIEDVAENASFVLGRQVTEFERAFAGYVGARHCIALNSGTSALHLALIAAGVTAGDEVITVPMTFVATCWAISYVAAKPVFVDVDPVTCTMNVDEVARRITPRTKAIVPVHLYGQMADMKGLVELSEKHGIPIIEDAAQAHGASMDGWSAGSIGRFGCFSFYPGKNLGAYGEGGAIVTANDAVAARLRALRDHAQTRRYHHNEIGFNYRMDGFQGAVLGVKLKYLNEWTRARRALAATYRERLSSTALRLPTEANGRHHVWHLFVVRHPERDHIRSELELCGIHTGMHYPVPVHLQEAYKSLGHAPNDFPVSERIANECFSLPLYPELTTAQQNRVIDSLCEIVGEFA